MVTCHKNNIGIRAQSGDRLTVQARYSSSLNQDAETVSWTFHTAPYSINLIQLTNQ